MRGQVMSMLKKGMILVGAGLAIGVMGALFKLPAIGTAILIGAVCIWVGRFME